jgi:hypothetical protein
MENYKLIQSVGRFKEIADELSNLYKDKNTNYGNSFGELYEELGPISGLVPLHNKLNRLKHLITTENKDNKFESIEDTIKDLASYAIMNLIEFEKYRDKHTKTIKLTNNKISISPKTPFDKFIEEYPVFIQDEDYPVFIQDEDYIANLKNIENEKAMSKRKINT